MNGSLPPGVAAVVAEVSRALGEAGVVHEIGGSVLVAMLGAPVVPGDVDVVVAGADRSAVAAALPWPQVDPPPPGPVWRSAWVDRYRAPGCGVDVIGDPALARGTRVLYLPMGGGTPADVGGEPVTLADPAVWMVVYAVVRPERADLLARVAGPAAVARARRLWDSVPVPGTMAQFPLSP